MKSTPQSNKAEDQAETRVSKDPNERSAMLKHGSWSCKTLTSEAEKLDQDDQRIKVIELDKLEEPTEESASIVRGDWIHRIRPVVKNLSKRSMKYWTILESVVEERYRKYLASSLVERLKLDFKDDEEASKDEYSQIRAIIHVTLLKAIPKDLVTEAVQKRHEDPTKATLTIMVKYQLISKKGKRSLSAADHKS